MKDVMYSVQEVADILKGCFDNPYFNDITVYGEIYSLKRGKFTYIEIGDKDQDQVKGPLLKCAFSTFYNNDINFDEISVGDIIKVHGRLTYYAHGSSVTLWGDKLEVMLKEMGASLLLKRKTLEKLDKLGYLDEKRKRPIPKYCSNVAIVTAKDSAAYSDIIKTLHSRFPVSTTLYPAIVQGDNASKSMILALEKAKEKKYDCLILGRGGGSKTDLSCFDDEKLALTIATYPVPIITCIGHTIDTSVADRVSDKMAITPTEAASLINPSLEEVEEKHKEYISILNEKIEDVIQDKALYLDGFLKRLDSLSPKRYLSLLLDKNNNFKKELKRSLLDKIKRKEDKMVTNKENITNYFLSVIDNKLNKVHNFISLLEAYSPANIANKGYALIYKDNKKVKSISELKEDDEVVITYTDGRKKAIIKR